MNAIVDVIVTGIGLELPGVDTADLRGASPAQLAPDAFDPKAKVARKGVRYKDRATLLAMSAGLQALRDADLATEPELQTDAPAFGVVVSSNLGNLDTVVNVVRAIRATHVNDASAMDLPNASSNVIASSLAIRHGLQGPNLMLCNGATSGLDALHLAANCIRAGRAQRMLVAGVEVDNEVTRALPGAPAQWFNGAIAVVLESAVSAAARGAPARGRIGEYRFVATGAQAVASASHIDVTPSLGESYGAEGLAQLVMLLQAQDKAVQRATLVCGGKFGDRASALLEAERLA